MSQDWFVYSFVARGPVILAEHTAGASDLPDISAQWLESLTTSPERKFTMKHNHHIFNFLLDDGYVYGVVARESVRSEILFEFLERIREDFKKRYGRGKGGAATGKSLSKSFGPTMKEHMQYVVDHAEEIDKLAKVKAQISDVKVILLDNINKVLERGDVIDRLAIKAEELNESSLGYKKNATKINRKMWYQNMKMKLFMLGIFLLILVLILWTSICHGFKC